MVIASGETDAFLEMLFDPEFIKRGERLPAGVKWNPPTPEGAHQVLYDAVRNDGAARKRRRERIARAEAALTGMGV